MKQLKAAIRFCLCFHHFSLNSASLLSLYAMCSSPLTTLHIELVGGLYGNSPLSYGSEWIANRMENPFGWTCERLILCICLLLIIRKGITVKNFLCGYVKEDRKQDTLRNGLISKKASLKLHPPTFHKTRLQTTQIIIGLKHRLFLDNSKGSKSMMFTILLATVCKPIKKKIEKMPYIHTPYIHTHTYIYIHIHIYINTWV